MEESLSPVSNWFTRNSKHKLFLVSFLPLALIFTLVVKLVVVTGSRAEVNSLIDHQASRLETATSILDASVRLIISDMMVLAETPALQALTRQKSAEELKHVSGLFVAFAGEKPIYDQIRYLNADGMEIVRVNNGGKSGQKPQVVPAAQLQNKNQRYYFRDTAVLQAGEVYISPMDLNIENNLVEEPHKPMLRLGTPLYRDDGKLDGVIILNLKAEALTRRFTGILDEHAQPMLLNSHADWLVGPEAELEWGFMFGHPSGFSRRWPAVWQAMLEQNRGHITAEAGLFSFNTVYPGRGEVPEQNQETFFWKTVALLPPEQLPSSLIFGNPLSATIYVSGLLFLMIVCGYLAHIIAGRRWLHGVIEYNTFQYREIMATLGEGVLVLDFDGAVREMNPEAERLLGWNRRDLLGQDAHALIHQHPLDGMGSEDCPIRRVVITGETYRSEDEAFIRRDGSRFVAGVTSAPLTRGGVVIGTVIAFRDITEIRQQQEEIRHLAYHDTLTGLPNRRLLLDRLEMALARARRHATRLALMYVDLDNFKEVNDSTGHEGGDELLRQVATHLGWMVRETDTVTRQGGDEFIILLPDIGNQHQAEEIAGRLVSRLAEPFSVLGHEVSISVSVGLAFYPDNAGDIDSLMNAADGAMYEAKRSGKNRYVISAVRGPGNL